MIEDPSLGQELVRAFHTTDDPVCLTEILRLLYFAAMTAPATVTRESELASESVAKSVLQVTSESVVESAAESAMAALATESAAELAAESTAGSAAESAAKSTETELATESAKSAAAAVAGLAPALATMETLERLGFFLASCLEEKLLSRVSSRRVPLLLPG